MGYRGLPLSGLYRLADWVLARWQGAIRGEDAQLLSLVLGFGSVRARSGLRGLTGGLGEMGASIVPKSPPYYADTRRVPRSRSESG